MPRRVTANEAPRTEISHRHILFVAIGLVLWMLAIGARLVQLQIHQHDDLASRARNQQLSSIDTAPTRGQVLDRQGRELARSLDTESFFSDPSEVKSVEETSRKIASVTGGDRAELIRRFNDAKDANKKFIWIVRRLEMAVERSHAKSGTAIVMDPHTGEILALANAPTFDPNQPGANPPEARANGALQSIYEPGSTFKIVAYSAAIEKGLVKPDDKIDCQMGQITVAGRLIHDGHPYGVLTIADALAKSSNVGAIKLGLLVGNESMYEYMKRLGFGSRTGIDLAGESPGILRPLSRWQPSSIGSLAIGQEVGVTPLQMATAYSVLANGGTLVKPHLLRELRAPDGTVLFQAKPETRPALKAETTEALRSMFEGVTLHGTAKKAQLDGYTAAAKTGTAQKVDPRTHAYSATKFIGSFVGFAPVNNPAGRIIGVIDEP